MSSGHDVRWVACEEQKRYRPSARQPLTTPSVVARRVILRDFTFSEIVFNEFWTTFQGIAESASARLLVQHESVAGQGHGNLARKLLPLPVNFEPVSSGLARLAPVQSVRPEPHPV